MKYVLFSYWVANAICTPRTMLEAFAVKDSHSYFSMAFADSIVIRETEIESMIIKWGKHKKRELKESEFIN